MTRPLERPSYYVQSLERGLTVLRVFDEDSPKLTLAEVARGTGLTRAAARRFLLTLVDLGYVRNEGRLFNLTPRVLELGYAYLSSQPLPQVAEPHLERLVAEVQESSSVSVLDGDDIVYVARVATSRIMTVTIAIGSRLPAYATSMGRVLLSGLPPADLDAYLERATFIAHTDRTLTLPADLRAAVHQVAAQGWALVDQELELGLRSIAAPVRKAGRVAAAVNVSTHTSRWTLQEIRQRLLPPLLDTVSRIEQDFALAGPS